MYVSVPIYRLDMLLLVLSRRAWGHWQSGNARVWVVSKVKASTGVFFSLELLDLAFFYLDIIPFLGLLEMGDTRIGSVTVICSAEAVRS